MKNDDTNIDTVLINTKIVRMRAILDNSLFLEIVAELRINTDIKSSDDSTTRNVDIGYSRVETVTNDVKLTSTPKNNQKIFVLFPHMAIC